jgi:hypothetical protein
VAQAQAVELVAQVAVELVAQMQLELLELQTLAAAVAAAVGVLTLVVLVVQAL